MVLGIGDDCALLSPPADKLIAISTDTLISGVHFPENTQAQDIGYKALAVNLSDLAAMGATPAWVSLAITLPNANKTWLEDFMQGFNLLAQQYQLSLIGGDTTRGSLSITVTAMGFVSKNGALPGALPGALRRNQAKAGDIFVTGTYGMPVRGSD